MIKPTAPDFSNLPIRPTDVAIYINCMFDAETGSLDHGKFMLDVDAVNAYGEKVKPSKYEENFVVRSVLYSLLSALDEELKND